MSRKDRLQKLLGNPHIWKQGRHTEVHGSAVDGSPAYEKGLDRKKLPTGFHALDELLGGGWPLGTLTEILLEEQGVGELRLLMPALNRLGQALRNDTPQARIRRKICWITPPHIPYAPALAHHGLDLSQLLIINSEHPTDALWATEQSLRSHACVAVLGWFNRIDARALRRLQLATEESGCLAVVFRHAGFSQRSAAAPLRIQLEARETALQLQVIRNRYGRLGSVLLPC